MIRMVRPVGAGWGRSRGGGGGGVQAPWVLHNLVARRGRAGFPMIGKNVSSGWKNPAGVLGVGQDLRDVLGNKWNNGGNKSRGELGRSVNYDWFRQWRASLKSMKNAVRTGTAVGMREGGYSQRRAIIDFSDG